MIVNILMAIGLMICGFVAFALMYFLRKNTWNGFKDIQKVTVAIGLFSIISILLVTVPEAAELLKTLLGLDVSIESSKVGFITLGLAFAGIVSSKLNSTSSFDKPVIIINVDAFPTTGITGVWYHFNNNYWYWNGSVWTALYDNLGGPGGGTNPPPTGLPPLN